MATLDAENAHRKLLLAREKERGFMKEEASSPAHHAPSQQEDARNIEARVEAIPIAQEPSYNPMTGIVTMQSEQFAALIYRVIHGA